MTRTTQLLLPRLLVVVGLLWPLTAASVPINYGDVVGINVIYRQVTEKTLSAGDADGLFGAPVGSGDAIDFNPVGFASQSSGFLGNDITDVELTFGIEAKPNHLIDSIILTETGDYTLVGTGDAGTLAAVASSVIIEVLEVDFQAIVPIQIQTSMTFTPSDGDFDLFNDGSAILAGWTGSLDFDVAGFLADNLIIGDATLIQVTLDNQLVTLSQDGTTAFIAKKDTDGLSITTNVPEPSTGLLATLGLVGLGLRDRRRRKAAVSS